MPDPRTPAPACPSSLVRAPEERFQFGERLFDRIEVRTVRRQKSDLRADRFDGRAGLWLFVPGEIVEHDHLAGL